MKAQKTKKFLVIVAVIIVAVVLGLIILPLLGIITLGFFLVVVIVLRLQGKRIPIQHEEE